MSSISLEYTDTGTAFCIIAGIIYAVKFKTLSPIEKPIAVVIWLNITCDLIGFFFGKSIDITSTVYNLLLPTERIISLLIYACALYKNVFKSIYGVGIGLIVLTRIVSTLFEAPLTEFQFIANTIEGLTVAILSYIFIRSSLTRKAEFSINLFAFGIANLLYLTLMASAMSAVKPAISIDPANATALFGINTLAYIFWSIILIIAILWKKQKI